MGKDAMRWNFTRRRKLSSSAGLSCGLGSFDDEDFESKSYWKAGMKKDLDAHFTGSVLLV
jgi:hypothetical protein